ncbi:hypothetical protein [Marisediminicola sp. LYQ134]|uniref:hypothetical protein n=1 Tax=Marisediminicola sp. LYQ134 TaxID=3391061 RepID=UPI0039835841
MTDDAPHAPQTRSGRSLLRVLALFCLGIVGGAVLGMLAGAALAVVAGSWQDAPLYIVFSGAAGAFVATLAAVGSLAALLVTDRWDERSPQYRMVSAGIGAAGVVASGCRIFIGAETWSAGLSTPLLVIFASLVVGLIAGLGLGLFERQMRHRDFVRQLRALQSGLPETPAPPTSV